MVPGSRCCSTWQDVVRDDPEHNRIQSHWFCLQKVDAETYLGVHWHRWFRFLHAFFVCWGGIRHLSFITSSYPFSKAWLFRDRSRVKSRNIIYIKRSWQWTVAYIISVYWDQWFLISVSHAPRGFEQKVECLLFVAKFSLKKHLLQAVTLKMDRFFTRKDGS